MGRIKRVATLSLVLISLTVAQFPVDGQTRRTGARQSGTTPPRPIKSDQNATRQVDQTDLVSSPRVELTKSPRSLALAKAFESGKPPEPLRMPPGTVDEQAATLAKALSAGDDSSTAALYAAVLAAGYGVRGVDGSVMQTTEHGQGLLADTGEIAATAKLYGEGYGVGLAYLGQAFTKVPALNDVPLGNILLEGIRLAAKNDHPAVRFWGRFIVELGKNSSAPYDLLGQVNSAEVRLDAVQVYLILSRLAGDLALLKGPSQARLRSKPEGTALEKKSRGYSHHVEFSNRFVGRVRSDSKFVDAGLAKPAQQPCGSSDVQGVILDWTALGTTSLHGKLLERLGHTGQQIPIANIVLTVLKFILTYAMLETKIELIGPPPLVRTKDTSPGEQRILVGSVWIENKAQFLNCLRPFLNQAGLDFNLPNSGPLTDVNVVWEGVLGFAEDNRGWISTAQDFISNLGKKPAPGKKIVYFDFFPGTGNSRTQRTGSRGLSIIYVVGAPQEKDLSREKLTRVAEAAGVMFRVQVKSTQVKDLSAQLGTIGDFAGPVIALLTGDVAGGAVGLATETLYRMSWRGSDPFYFVVRDWEPCKGEWIGSMSSSVSRTVKHDFGNPATGFIHLTESTYSFDASISLNAGGEAIGSAHAEETLSDLQDDGPGGKISLHRTGAANYSGEVEASVNVDSYGNYSVGFGFPTKVMGTSQQTVQFTHPRKKSSTATSSDPWEAYEYIRSIKGKVDPNNQNAISDSRTWSNDDGVTQYTFKVKVVRCQE